MPENAQAAIAANPPNLRPDKVELPIYDDTSNGANPGEFLKRWEELRTRYAWDEVTHMSYVSGGLKGEARHWWDEILGAQRHTPLAKTEWRAFCVAFRERFTLTKYSYDLVELMSRMKQKKGESITLYADRGYFLTTQLQRHLETRKTEPLRAAALATKQNVDDAYDLGCQDTIDDMVLMLFKAGILDDFRKEAWKSKCEYLGSTVTELKQLERTLKKAGTSTWSAKVAALEQEEDSEDSEIAAVGASQGARKKKSDFFAKKKKEKSQQKSNFSAAKPSYSKELLCDYCARTNHKTSDCFIKKRAEALRSGGTKSRTSTVAAIQSGNE
jgi:hypothetical protein